jgi:hypothetical protein
MLKFKIQSEAAVAEVPLAFARYLENREQDEKILEIVIVYNGVDRYDTIIEPTGMRTSASVVPSDLNHSGVHSGAYFKQEEFRVEKNYVTVDGNVLEEALIGKLHVPKGADLKYKDNNGVIRSAGNFYEEIEKAQRGEATQILAFSVTFRPVKQKTNIRTGITTFTEWDLLSVSPLNTIPGQQHSSYKIIRGFINQENQFMERSLYYPEAGEYVVNEETQAIYKIKQVSSQDTETVDTKNIILEKIRGDGEQSIAFTVNTNDEIEGYCNITLKMLADIIFEQPINTNQSMSTTPTEEARNLADKENNLEIDVKVNTTNLDEALEKAEKLKRTLEEINQINVRADVQPTNTETPNENQAKPTETVTEDKPQETDDEAQARAYQEAHAKITTPIEQGKPEEAEQLEKPNDSALSDTKVDTRSFGERLEEAKSNQFIK